MIRAGDQKLDTEMVTPGSLVAVRGRYLARNSDGSLLVEIPVANGFRLRLEAGDILCGLDVAGQIPAAEVVGRTYSRSGQDEVLLRVHPLVAAGAVAPAPLGEPPSWERTRQIMAAQDDLMISIENDLPLHSKHLQSLPPWRALFWAGLAEKVQDARGEDAEVCLRQGTMGQLRAECKEAADGMRYPGDWWLRP